MRRALSSWKITLLQARIGVRCLSDAPTFKFARAGFVQDDMTKKTRKAIIGKPEDEEFDENYGVNDPTKWQVDPRTFDGKDWEWWHIPGRIKEAIWTLHHQDPEKWSIQVLSDNFGFHVDRIKAVLMLKRIEKEQWKPEDLHHDFEMAVEGAIELYRKERDCEGLTSEHPAVQELEEIYEILFKYYGLERQIELQQAKVKKCPEEEEKAVLQSELTTLEEEFSKTFKTLYDYLRPDISRPMEDRLDFNHAEHGPRAKPAPFDLAIQGRLVPPATEGPGSGKTILDSETAKAARQRPNRHHIVISDISESKKGGAVKVVVREKDASLRHPSRNELERATQIEKAVPRSVHIRYQS